MNPLVSVIIPVHNGEKYLKECLDSVVSQTLKDIEIICVNDGSTDGSLDLLNDYQVKDSRIKIISQESSNAGHARNVGLAYAIGEYLSFLDCDDWFEKEMLKSMFSLGKKVNADIVFCKAETYNQKTKTYSSKSYSLKERLVPKNKVFSCRDIQEDAFQFCRTAAWDKLYKASFIKDEKILFQEQPRMNDCFFTSMANIHAKRMIVCNQIFVHYRINIGVSITSSPEKTYPCTLNTFKRINEFLSENDLIMYKKSWQNFILRKIVEEFAFFPEEIAYKYYMLLKKCNFNLNKMKKSEIYDQDFFDLYIKYFDKDIDERSFKEQLPKYHQDISKKRRQSNLIKSMKGFCSLIRSHNLRTLLNQIKYFLF